MQARISTCEPEHSGRSSAIRRHHESDHAQMNALVRTLVLAVAGLSLLSIAARRGEAQIGTTTEIIAGRVVGPDSQPLPGARVDVTSLETGVVKHTVTKADGRFTLLFRDGGAQYTVSVKFIGMAPATMTLTRQADEDRLVADVRMGRTAVTLSAVQVKAATARPGAPPASAAGGTERSLPTQLLERLPVSPGDLASVASLSPGVVLVAGTDTTPASFSVAGQPSNQNNVTVDGGSFLFGTLPQNGVRSVRVVTNAYDVSRGQFTGGQVATTTLSGTPTFQGSATAISQQPSLQFPAPQSPTFGQRYTQSTGSFGAGGPLIGDASFYFASVQYDRKVDPVTSLLDAGSALSNLGVSADSVARFLQLIGRDGLSGRDGAPTTRLTTTLSSLARVDWDVGESSSLMFRADYRHLAQDATRIAPLALPGTGGSSHSDGGGFMTSLTSSLGNFINEARAYASSDQQSSAAFLASPLGVVTVASDLSAGDQGVTSLQFGGNPGLPRSSTTRLLEGSDELSWLVGEAHRLKLGGLLNVNRSSLGVVPNRYGTFLFNSLADFDAGRPALFARTLSGEDQFSGTDNAALYLGDAWRFSPSFQLVYGARVEATHLPGAPAENPLVAQDFGRRTDHWPTDVQITPRLGFTYLLGNVAGLPSGALRGGLGEFRGTVPTSLVGAVRNATGLPGSQSNLLCVGDAVPAPDWPGYLSDPGSIPTGCVGGAQPGFASTQPAVYVFDNSFGAPRVWRASTGYTQRFNTAWALSLDGLFAYGVHSPFANDINLPAPGFTLAAEGDRPVFAAPGSIVPTTGGVAALSNRPHPEFGPVLSMGSGLRSRTGQMTASITGPGLRAGFTTISYTFNRSLDQSNGFALGNYLPTTAGDPNKAEWGTSDLERRHQIVGTIYIPFANGFTFSVIGRTLSGPRYTPLVNGDVNGDGSRNDRAFIPLPSASSAVSSDLARLLATTDPRAADCIRAQWGEIAGRNSCTTPWTPQLDLQLNWSPRVAAFDDRLMVSLVATNTLAGLDRLLHGQDIRGWGQPINPDRTLLSVTGFNPQTQSFVYKVNDHFGTPQGNGSAFSVPFQISVRAQVTLGTDANKARLNAITGGSNGAAASVKEVKDRILAGVPFPVKMLLEQADSLKLGLSTDQRAHLTVIADTYARQIDSVGAVVAQILIDAGPHPDLGALAPRMQSINLGVVKVLQQAVKDAQGVLSAEQWAKLPERIRFPLSAPPPPPPRP
jgi:hypothetical protein